MRRLELYYFLLPFTAISLLLYFRVLREIYRLRHTAAYSSLFYRITWSLALYDVSFVLAYFVIEIPQDWPQLYGVFSAINGTILPQLHFAHRWLCQLAQVYGVTLMSLSRLMQVCYPTSRGTVWMGTLSAKAVVVIHGIPPLIYALYILFFQQWRTYEYDAKAGAIKRMGDAWSVEFNTNVMIAVSTSGALISILCYIQVFAQLRNRTFRSWSKEVSVLVTSFILFCSLCALCAHFLINKLSLLAENWGVYYTNRDVNYVVSFTISLSSPWCLLITNSMMRSAVFRTLVCLHYSNITSVTSSGYAAPPASPPNTTLTTI